MDIGNAAITYEGDVKTVMDERGIKEADIREVISWAEGEGGKLLNPEGTRFLGKKRLENFTVYAEYSAADGSFVIYNVYSHRVSLREDA